MTGEADLNRNAFCSPSYPKTGNTWVRVLLGRYFQIAYGLAFLPLMEGTQEEVAALSRRVVFHHGPLTWEAQTANDLNDDNVCRPYLNERVILIVRHPLDCLLSLYMQTRYRSGHQNSGAIPSFNDFLDAPIFGLAKFLKFHNLWAKHLPNNDIHLLRYEDLRGEPKKTAARLLRFLELPVNDGWLSDAMAYSSFENMQQLEAGSALTYRSSGLNIFATGDRANPDALHVRAGKVGGYKDHLSAEELNVHIARLKTLDPIFGYSTADDSRSSSK